MPNFSPDEKQVEQLGGTDTSVGVEVDVREAVSWWRRFWAWLRGSKQPSQIPDCTGFERDRQEAIDRIVDAEMAEVCGETDEQRRQRERHG